MFTSSKQKLATHSVDLNNMKQEGKRSGNDKTELEEKSGIYPDLLFL